VNNRGLLLFRSTEQKGFKGGIDMEEKITCEVDTNYDDRRPIPNNITVNWTPEQPDKIWFNITMSEKREDDYVIVSVKLADILHAIGKAIQEEKD